MTSNVVDGRLEGKIALVTGGASGIGAASAVAMAREGAAVVVTDIDEAGARSVAEGIVAAGGRAVGALADMGDHAQIRASVALAVDEFGGIDVLFNNAAALNLVPADRGVVEFDLDVWEGQIRVNLTGPMLACRYAIPHMIERGGGSIVHTASVSGMRGQDGYTAYSSTKAGLMGLSRSIATTYGKQGIRSNCIAPGFTLSPTVFDRWDPEVKQIWLDHTLTPDVGRSEDQAAAVVFLAADESRFVTGQVLPVDGGLTSYLPTTPTLRRQGTPPRDGDA